MQPVENLKDGVLVFGLNTDAVITNRKDPVIALVFSGNMNLRLDAFAGILDRIAEQILQHMFDPGIGD